MNKRVLKWAFQPTDVLEAHNVPVGATLLTVHEQDGNIAIWFLCDVLPADTETRTFRVYGTGHEMPEDMDASHYVGTAHLAGGDFVLHVFEPTPF